MKRRNHSQYRFLAIGVVVVMALFSVLLSGCMSNSGNSSKTEKSMKIAIGNKGSYPYYYGDYIEAAFPDLKVELIELDPDFHHPLTDEQYVQKIKEENPDLLLIWEGSRYKKLANEGLLEELTPRMIDSGMKEDQFYPGMLELARQNDNGKLYGLLPSFQSSVLYYNIDIFDKYKVEQPHDGMTMIDVMELAGKLAQAGSNKDGVVGYHQPFSSMPYNLIDRINYSEGIRSYNFTTGKVTVDTPAWKRALSTVVNLYKNGTFLMQDVKGDVKDGTTYYGQEEISEAELFQKGKAAMKISSYNGIKNMKFKVGMVTPPVSSLDNTRSFNIDVNNYMAIREGAANGDTAWELIRFMNGDYMAKVRSGLEDYDFASNKSYLTYNHDPLVRKLYELLPLWTPGVSFAGYDSKFFTLFQDLVNQEVTAAVKGEKSVDQIIAAIQKEGQALLDAAKIKK
ncbi:ABC transporter substrate-binding protein [Paenibacillus baekrokdamisoli]|nr:extracellular solute-binding protein [Paenibacillus baekrokdamisoli]